MLWDGGAFNLCMELGTLGSPYTYSQTPGSGGGERIPLYMYGKLQVLDLGNGGFANFDSKIKIRYIYYLKK